MSQRKKELLQSLTDCRAQLMEMLLEVPFPFQKDTARELTATCGSLNPSILLLMMEIRKEDRPPEPLDDKLRQCCKCRRWFPQNYAGHSTVDHWYCGRECYGPEKWDAEVATLKWRAENWK